MPVNQNTINFFSGEATAMPVFVSDRLVLRVLDVVYHIKIFFVNLMTSQIFDFFHRGRITGSSQKTRGTTDRPDTGINPTWSAFRLKGESSGKNPELTSWPTIPMLQSNSFQYHQLIQPAPWTSQHTAVQTVVQHYSRSHLDQDSGIPTGAIKTVSLISKTHERANH